MKTLRPVITAALLASLTVLQLHGNIAAARQDPPRVTQENQRQAERQRRAKADAIADTFCYYNRALNRKSAENYAKHIIDAAARYNLDPGLIAAIIVKESCAKYNARSKYAVGLMQVYWRLHKKAIQGQFPHIKSEKDVIDPHNNIFVGTWLFSQYMINCKGNVKLALQRYLGSKSGKYVAQVMSYKNYYSARLSHNLRQYAKRQTE